MPARGAQLEWGKTKLFWPQECCVFPQVGSREELILYSLSSSGVVQEWPHSRLWATAQSHPADHAIRSKWDWHFSSSHQPLCSQGCAGPGLVFRAAQLGNARMAGWYFLADAQCVAQHRDVSTGGILLLWTCCQGKQLQWSPEPMVSKNKVRSSVWVGKWRSGDLPVFNSGCGSLLMRWKTKGRMCSTASPNILCEFWIAPGQVVVLGKAVAPELVESLALLPAQYVPGLCGSVSSAAAWAWGVWRTWPFPAAALLSSPFPPAPGAANRILHSSFHFPFLPGCQLYLRFQARGASSWHSLLYGWQHSLSSGWQRTLYRTHDLIMTSCLSKFILPFHMDKNVLFHTLLSPSILK